MGNNECYCVEKLEFGRISKLKYRLYFEGVDVYIVIVYCGVLCLFLRSGRLVFVV